MLIGQVVPAERDVMERLCCCTRPQRSVSSVGSLPAIATIPTIDSLLAIVGLFENALNFKFQKSGPPTPQQISQASAAFAAKKISQVDSEVVQYFLPFAQHLIKSADSAAESDDLGLDLSADLDTIDEVGSSN